VHTIRPKVSNNLSTLVVAVTQIELVSSRSPWRRLASSGRVILRARAQIYVKFMSLRSRRLFKRPTALPRQRIIISRLGVRRTPLLSLIRAILHADRTPPTDETRCDPLPVIRRLGYLYTHTTFEYAVTSRRARCYLPTAAEHSVYYSLL